MDQTKVIALVVMMVTLAAGIYFSLRLGNWLFLVGACVICLPDVVTIFRKSDIDKRKR